MISSKKTAFPLSFYGNERISRTPLSHYYKTAENDDGTTGQRGSLKAAM